MKISGSITLLIDGIGIQKLRYESKDDRGLIIANWRLYKLGEVSYSISPDIHEHTEPTIGEAMKLYAWDFQPYKPPYYGEREDGRPKAVYSNKNYAY